MSTMAAPLSVSSTSGALMTELTSSAWAAWAAVSSTWIPVLSRIAPTAASIAAGGCPKATKTSSPVESTS